ncbi:repeat-containing protein [Seminavis robusta]|uniref:Repeat-containing protein n=1 Tax=Seminavis robusta TaxID=568900 RepID=A0A9N8D6W9_9STRA|nr:repeat-containing protein [Seminavis robusta]|eukprot:Sro4_g003100.1 repeat-containing protein (692) ;mRNA; r:45121-47603
MSRKKCSSLFLVLWLLSVVFAVHGTEDGDPVTEERIIEAKLDLWSRGAFQFGDQEGNNDDSDLLLLQSLQEQVHMAPLRLGPVRQVRRDTLREQKQQTTSSSSNNGWLDQLLSMRGGDAATTTADLQKLGAQLGPDFVAAIAQNEKDHAQDCQKSCEMFYCAQEEPTVSISALLHNDATKVASYSMGAVPPEDFAQDFGFPLDLIKVTQDLPLFSAEEAARVIENAEAEGVHENEYKSGKYQLGGDWLINLPNTRKWFNERLESTFFPLLAHLFPEVISSPAVLRAHSVSLLKYNSSHPRTDVHIDNGILALTIAMTPQDQYQGGGTFFEHMGVENVLEMDVGHGTFRPGSVRHGGHRVTGGTRYILGAFLLLKDKVEHVRRLKNKGSELRRTNDLETAAKYFEWALAINPKCTTCLKDWAEILHSQKKFDEAEAKIRQALELLENKDSDALFTLGVLLSAQGRDDESIEAYQQSVKLNAEDAELCYNLGIKLGAKGKTQEEMEMYAKAVQADPKFGGAWLNWGTSLAERGNLDEAETMFLKAVECDAEVAAKAMFNLGLLYSEKANQLAQAGEIKEAKSYALKASDFVDAAKPILEELAAKGKGGVDIANYINQLKPLRLRCHRMVGQLLASEGDMAACEHEFRKATESFPSDPSAWQMLGRVLEMQGKANEASEVAEKVKTIIATSGWK